MVVRTIGSYIIGKTLGEGASAKVKLGVNRDTGERVALKLVKNNDDILGEKLVKSEISAMLNLKHENVLGIKEVLYDAKYPKKNGQIVPLILIVIEFAGGSFIFSLFVCFTHSSGGELFEFLAVTGPFDETVARSYFKQLIDGIAYCHQRNIAHRDLKPENLLFDEHFTLKIADFGFSQLDEHATKCTFTQCGSPGYMAPEVMLKTGYDPQKADLWACGVILFIMVAGFPPYQKADSSDWWFDKLLSGTPFFFPFEKAFGLIVRIHIFLPSTGDGDMFWKAHSRVVNISEELKHLILRILCCDASKRISLEELQKNSWMQGPTLDKADLRTQFNSRKILVAHEQERAKLVAKQKKEVCVFFFQSDPREREREKRGRVVCAV